ncbi:hypothetical protein GCM10010123_28770 [Pilimelia anulata]|uniref:Uncharacterized protein n=1 Tax=Pilimelia anulata TaxID=53371 RepID=A0A8J3B5H8_9ACTN|nr:hypothetical protein GCM10010123_28770 [Pilimelia anulata]
MLLGAGAGAVALGALPSLPAAAAARWSAEGEFRRYRVEGCDAEVALRAGDAATVLLHCVRRFAYGIDDSLATADLVGHLPDARGPHAADHRSGTAVAVRPAWYPAGAAGGFVAREEALIRDILLDLDGVVRWGADLDPVQESLFRIDVGPGDERLAAVAARIRGWAERPGEGAGADIDPADPARLRRATALTRRQRSSD